MNEDVRYAIDDTDQIRPHMRLCHRLLSEGLTAGFSIVELATPPDGMPTARAQVGDALQPLMAFPPPVYAMLVEYLKQMAGVPQESSDASGTILVRLGGRDASVGFSARRDERGQDELALHFPTEAAT
jgi:hypothetical protein